MLQNFSKTPPTVSRFVLCDWCVGAFALAHTSVLALKYALLTVTAWDDARGGRSPGG